MTFAESKIDFDKQCKLVKQVTCHLPVHLTFGKVEKKLKKKDGSWNEQYYKWQFLYSITNSGLYALDFIGTEVCFPKGNKSSKPLKMDAAIFDDKDWFSYYKKFHNENDQSSLDWLRKHLIAVIEFKKEDSKEIDTVWNQQLKAGLKESESDFCLGILYDTERLYLFKKVNGKFLRYDEQFNTKQDESDTRDLSLHLTDRYSSIPSFDELLKKTLPSEDDLATRSIDELSTISGMSNTQLTDGISEILRVMDKYSLNNQIGYKILIHSIALKIYDEQCSDKSGSYTLYFYIDKFEYAETKVSEKLRQKFINRQKLLYKNAALSPAFQFVLDKTEGQTINWKREEHVRLVAEIVKRFQDFSFVRSHSTDLYQLVFYKFASAFIKAEKAQFLTPIHIIDFLVKLVNPRGNESVIDPTSGIADFLSLAYVNSSPKLHGENLYAADNDEQMIMLAQLNMLLSGVTNSNLKVFNGLGSISQKFDIAGNSAQLSSEYHKSGAWDNWADETILKKFNVVLTNPPFGEDRAFIPKDKGEKDAAKCYELWDIYGNGKIDLGVVFLENAYRVLEEHGRIGIVLSNSIASIDSHLKARKWLWERMRIVAMIDLPANVFGETGVNTTLIIAYKPTEDELSRLLVTGYSPFTKTIKKVGYEVKTSKRVKIFSKIYKVDPTSFKTMIDEDGGNILDEDFTQTVSEFRRWCLSQEETLQKLFINGR